MNRNGLHELQGRGRGLNVSPLETNEGPAPAAPVNRARERGCDSVRFATVRSG